MDAAVLQCIICPGEPRFSDVSHLLTHVASKAHLAYYFKLQVRSHQEVEALELLQEYDDWYNTNNLAQLLSDRLTSKEARRKKRKPQASVSVGSNAQQTVKRPHKTEGPDQISAELDVPSFLDPRLVGSSADVKHEANTEDSSFVSCYITPSMSSAIADAQPPEQTNALSGSSRSMTSVQPHEWHHKGADQPGEACHIALPQTPKPPRLRHSRSGLSLTRNKNVPDPFVDGGDNAEITDDIEMDKERADEMARLKGILWPGMDIFDSATQQMRRKRNQKKDGSVLKMMEMTSLQVEPTELVFSPTGVLRKQRVISGNVEDDSPLKGETPIPKRRASRPKREPLHQSDPNIPRVQDRRRAKRTANQSRNNANLELFDGSPGASRRFPNPSGFGPSYAGGDSEFALSVQAFGKRPRTAFTIFADDDVQDKAFKDQRVRSKFPRETLTPARLVLGHKPENSAINGCRTDQPSLEKENIEPIMNSQGRIDLHNWHSPTNSAYVSGLFFEEPSGIGLVPEDELHKCDYRSNPLLAPASKIGFYENNPYEDDITMTNNGWPALSRAVSSEATVSEEDQHELARLYLAGSVE
ncbi:uncharacterized protein N7459_006900 [Penicillium hispanicum]|uniref:uncharacterized protein n=1 Tax=Penicillium hispanicum TaxID=1080232 RepID=UPI0025403D1A|nr:uncharacterized protein N7459_006900 [Penicillium hispanicum]KAJ5577936.1 hypothetical protein N7459_006900 [Penicillium hispanicum]